MKAKCIAQVSMDPALIDALTTKAKELGMTRNAYINSILQASVGVAQEVAQEVATTEAKKPTTLLYSKAFKPKNSLSCGQIITGQHGRVHGMLSDPTYTDKQVWVEGKPIKGRYMYHEDLRILYTKLGTSKLHGAVRYEVLGIELDVNEVLDFEPESFVLLFSSGCSRLRTAESLIERDIYEAAKAARLASLEQNQLQSLTA